MPGLYLERAEAAGTILSAWQCVLVQLTAAAAAAPAATATADLLSQVRFGAPGADQRVLVQLLLLLLLLLQPLLPLICCRRYDLERLVRTSVC